MCKQGNLCADDGFLEFMCKAFARRFFIKGKIPDTRDDELVGEFYGLDAKDREVINEFLKKF